MSPITAANSGHLQIPRSISRLRKPFPEIVTKLSSEFQKLFSDPKFVAFLDKQAVVAAPTTPEGFAAFLKQDRKDAETLIKIANTKKTEFKE